MPLKVLVCFISLILMQCGPSAFVKGKYDNVERENLLNDSWSETDMQNAVKDLVNSLISHQSIAKITTTEFQNCTWLRLHKQVDDVTRYRNRIPNYFLVRIATIIVEEQYLIGNIRFFVYVNMRKLKLRGCSREAYIRACKKYLDTEENGMIRRMMMERDFYGRLIYKNRNEVVVKLISELLRYHELSYQSPIATEKITTAKAA